ncbi:Ras family [Pelomyxa schiedti]|nr:Ras family [Pelomyxa schiedti]
MGVTSSLNHHNRSFTVRTRPENLHVVVCGCAGVGKRTLVGKFLSIPPDSVSAGTVPPAVDCLSDDKPAVPSVQLTVHQKSIETDGSRCNLSITTGDVEQGSQFYKSDSFIIVYDITSRNSFNALDAVRTQILGVIGIESPQINMVLVGNKSDLEAQRAVSRATAEEKARHWGCQFLEVSATTNPEIDNVFRAIIEASSREETFMSK